LVGATGQKVQGDVKPELATRIIVHLGEAA
jgi:hypothetical protein